MKPMISEIVEQCSNLPTKKDKIQYLRANNSVALRTVLKYALDPSIKFLLPKGSVPYKPTQAHESQGMLYSLARTLYLYVEGGNPNLKQLRREFLFIQLLESIDPKDAELLVAVKDKQLPSKGITLKLVKEAFGESL